MDEEEDHELRDCVDSNDSSSAAEPDYVCQVEQETSSSDDSQPQTRDYPSSVVQVPQDSPSLVADLPLDPPSDHEPPSVVDGYMMATRWLPVATG